jgi:hypothetical protein
MNADEKMFLDFVSECIIELLPEGNPFMELQRETVSNDSRYRPLWVSLQGQTSPTIILFYQTPHIDDIQDTGIKAEVKELIRKEFQKQGLLKG